MTTCTTCSKQPAHHAVSVTQTQYQMYCDKCYVQAYWDAVQNTKPTTKEAT